MLRRRLLSSSLAASLIVAGACGGGGGVSSTSTSTSTSGGAGGPGSGGDIGHGGGTSSTISSTAGSTGGGGAGSTTTTAATTSSGTGGSASVVLAGQYILPDDQYPESGTYDPVGHAFFVASLMYGDVLRVEADGTQSIFYPGTGEPDRLTLGMKVDAERRRLWVCSIVNDNVKPGDMWVLDADTGLLLADFALGDTFAGASCNDLALDPEGRAYVTDRENPNVYRVDYDASDVTIWASGPLLEPGVIGMNGAAFTPDGAKLIVTKYLSAKLIAISTVQPAQMVEVALAGDDFSGGVKVANGADGIVFVNDRLYVAFGDNVMQVTPSSASWSAATVKAQAIGTGYTAVTVAEGDLYAFRGHAVSFQFGLSPDLPFDIRRVDLGAF